MVLFTCSIHFPLVPFPFSFSSHFLGSHVETGQLQGQERLNTELKILPSLQGLGTESALDSECVAVWILVLPIKAEQRMGGRAQQVH